MYQGDTRRINQERSHTESEPGNIRLECKGEEVSSGGTGEVWSSYEWIIVSVTTNLTEGVL